MGGVYRHSRSSVTVPVYSSGLRIQALNLLSTSWYFARHTRTDTCKTKYDVAVKLCIALYISPGRYAFVACLVIGVVSFNRLHHHITAEHRFWAPHDARCWSFQHPALLVFSKFR